MDNSRLTDLLSRAEELFVLAGQLGQGFEQADRLHRDGGGSPEWEPFRRRFGEFCERLLDLRWVMDNPPDRTYFLSEKLREAAKIAKAIQAVTCRKDQANDFAPFFPLLNALARDGLEEVGQTRKELRLDEPFAFVDPPRTVPMGWEGTISDSGIRSPGDLRHYLEMRLSKIRMLWHDPETYHAQGREALRNALRGFDHLGLHSRPEPWPGYFAGMGNHEVERRLSVLVSWLKPESQATPGGDPRTETGTLARTKSNAPSEVSPQPRHSADFRSVDWFGTKHAFTLTQAACVRVLWEAWKNGTPELSQATILERAETASSRLANVFRNHPAWETMIVSGQRKGTFRLAAPENQAE